MTGRRPATVDGGCGGETRRWRSGVVAPNPVVAGAPPGFHEHAGKVEEAGGRPEWSVDVAQRRREGLNAEGSLESKIAQVSATWS